MGIDINVYIPRYNRMIHSRNLLKDPGLEPLLYPERRPPEMGLGGLSSISSGISYDDKGEVVSGGEVVMMVVMVCDYSLYLSAR